MLSVSGETESLDTVHHVTAYLGDVIGAITLTGSVVAFLKLQGIAPSAPLNLPGKGKGGNRGRKGRGRGREGEGGFLKLQGIAPSAPLNLPGEGGRGSEGGFHK